MNSPHEFALLLAGLRRVQASGFDGGAALATLVRTNGPVFRRAGARMLVLGEGSIVRGLSAGCPEADIVEQARVVIADGHSRIVRYDREHGFDALLEMGCGGEMEVLIEPLRADVDLRFVDAIEECMQTRSEGWMATAFACEGQCLEQPRRLVRTDHTVLDELDDPRLADALLSLAPEAAAGSAAAQVVKVGTRYGMFEVLVERIEPPLRVVLVGVNATSRALAQVATTLGWEPCLVEHRNGGAATAAPDQRTVVADAAVLTRQVAFDRRTAVVVMTHNLERDLGYLRALREMPLTYLGALGSRTRASRMRDAVEETTAPLHAPAGLDIGSETPEEIALAVAAEIQAVVAGRSGGPLSTSSDAIHGSAEST